jgi:hypothetical protein
MLDYFEKTFRVHVRNDDGDLGFTPTAASGANLLQGDVYTVVFVAIAEAEASTHYYVRAFGEGIAVSKQTATHYLLGYVDLADLVPDTSDLADENLAAWEREVASLAGAENANA